jgi:thioredoxin-like negative regulator of GroEL
VAGRYGITGVPALMVFRSGKAVERMAGVAAPRALKAWLEKAAGQTVPA